MRAKSAPRSSEKRNTIAWVAIAVLALFVLAAVLAPLFTRSPSEIRPLERLQGPSSHHWFSTDNFGRDIFSRVIYAGRTSLVLAVVVTGVSTVAGVIIGLISGYYRRIDGVVMRLVDGLLAFPPFVFAIAMVAALGGAGVSSEIIALSVVFTPRMARLVRTVTQQLRKQDYIRAAISSGSRTRSILLTHVLPNGASPIIVLSSFLAAEALLADAGLSFLGLGAQPPTPTWGNMISDSSPYLTSAPWFAVFPGVAIVLVVVALNVVGDAFRDRLDTVGVKRRTGV